MAADSELARLEHLRVIGALNDEEYLGARQKYLARLGTGSVAQTHLRRSRAGGAPVSLWQDAILALVILVGGVALGFAMAGFTSSATPASHPGPTVTVTVQTVTGLPSPTVSLSS